ncbi:MAG: tRNA (N6-isopentenyl adenosine(37)-C2)-methylthiotransferase MiaB [Ruminococcus sp.]|nr:tRNA (N6-isopentenyl adenosine(37)-C2)-methylthiotransferase MiaB [Ruminococcus sp.]
MGDCVNNGANTDSARSFLEAYTFRFKAENGHAPLAYVHSFGCQQNVSDGERLMGRLAAVGYEFTKDTDCADLIILNTCAVRENAEDRVFGNLGQLKKLKQHKPDLVIGVCGCMAQQQHVADKIKEAYRHVDLVFGTFAYNELYAMLYEVLNSRKRIFDQSERPLDIDEKFVQLRENKVQAFVPIMYGCNNFCTYCIVPYVRGRERSRSPGSVLNEVKELVSQGYKEITLLGQNVNSYSYGFPELLRSIDAIEGDFRIRFMSSHPKDASRDLIDTILSSKKICKQLHLPVQSGCDRILKAMNRHYTVEQYLDIVNYTREKKPDFSFTTDLIVGFPGETYEEFCMTKDLIRQVRYDNIYSFVYSKRSGTVAAGFEDSISDKQKGLWLRELLLEQRETSSRWLGRFVGRVCRVLVEGEGRTGEGYLTGKNDEGIIVEFKGDISLKGQFAEIKITKAMNWALSGELV